MEIDNSRTAPATVSANDQGVPVEKPGQGGGKTASDTRSTTGNTADRVSLTGEARQLQDLEAQVASQPVVDSQRVSAVKNAIENGTFSINPERIAEKLMSLEQAITDAR